MNSGSIFTFALTANVVAAKVILLSPAEELMLANAALLVSIEEAVN